MIEVEKPIYPYSARILSGGKRTEFSCPQYTRKPDGKWRPDGFINVIAKGQYDFRKGDMIIVHAADISGVNRQEPHPGSTYVSLFVEKVDHMTKQQVVEEPTRELLDDNIPEDLL